MQRILATIITLLLVLPAVGLASSTEVPATVSPGRLGERLGRMPTPRKNINIEIGDIVHTPALSQPEDYCLNLRRVIVQAFGACRRDDLRSFYQHYIGKRVTVAQLHVIAENITKYYQSRGYLLTKAIIPQQDLSRGVVRIKIVEGYIDKVTINDDVAELHPLLCTLVKRLKGRHPLLSCDLQRCILLINDLPGVQIAVEIVEIPGKIGAAELIVNVMTKQFHVAIGYDNHGSRWMGPQQYFAELGVNHLLRAGDSTDFKTIISSNGKELQLFHLAHETLLGCNGTRLHIAGEYGHNHPGFNLEADDAEGNSAYFAIGIERPFIRSMSRNLYVHLAFKLVNDKLVTGHETHSKDRVRMLEGMGHFDFVDMWNGVNLIRIRLTQGLDVFNATDEGSLQSNHDAPPTFTKVNGFVSRLQPLPGHFSIFIAGSGQYSFTALLLCEQFGFGGDIFGRAYNYSEIVGDSGVSGKAEIRYDTRPSTIEFKNAQYFVVYDAGVVWKRGVAETHCRESATSVGVGVRVQYTHYFNAEVEFDRALTRKILSEEIAGRKSDRFRGFFRITLHV